MKKYIIVTLVLIWSFLIIWLIEPTNSRINSGLYKDFLDLSFYGVVDTKFIDTSNHSYPTLVLRFLDKDSVLSINLIGEKSGLYNEIHISDTLLKAKNDSIVFRKSNGLLFKYNRVYW